MRKEPQNAGRQETFGLSKEPVENLESPLAQRVDFHEEIGSTQERARELARGNPEGTPGAPHGTIVISRVQTGGRGRLGRPWGSPPGGLWFSLVLRPRMPARFAARVTQTAAVGVAKALWQFGVEARIKWPNDLLVFESGEPIGRKICGILAETSVENVPVAAKKPTLPAGVPDDRPPSYVILGVGLNANLDPEDLSIPDREAATMRSELGYDVDLAALLGTILSNLNAELQRMHDFSAVLDDWRALDCTLGRTVRVRRFGQTLVGRAVDLTPEGALLLKTRGGTVELFEGEVERFVGPEGGR